MNFQIQTQSRSHNSQLQGKPELGSTIRISQEVFYVDQFYTKDLMSSVWRRVQKKKSKDEVVQFIKAALHIIIHPHGHHVKLTW